MSNLDDFLDGKPSQTTDLNSFLDGGAKRKGPGVIRKGADLGLGFASGALGAGKALTDAAGAGNSVSNFLDTATKDVDSLLSPQAQADRLEQSAIMKAAEGKGVYEGIKAGAKAFGVAPLQTAVGGLGSVVPTVAATMATGGGAVPAMLAGAATGMAMGAGTIKGSIYDDIKKRSLESGMTPDAADAAATQAQSYGGGNTDQIALGAALGMADAATGVTPIVSNMARKALGREAIQTLANEVKPGHGILRRAGMGALEEMPLEAAQGGQEQLATNIAAQRAGYQAGTWDNVASNATLEGLASAGPGAAFGVINKEGSAVPPPAVPPTTPPAIPPVSPQQDPSQAPPPQLGFNPMAGTHTIFPDGSIVLNSESANGASIVRARREADRQDNITNPFFDNGLPPEKPQPNPVRAAVQAAADAGGALSSAAVVSMDSGASQPAAPADQPPPSALANELAALNQRLRQQSDALGLDTEGFHQDAARATDGKPQEDYLMAANDQMRKAMKAAQEIPDGNAAAARADQATHTPGRGPRGFAPASAISPQDNPETGSSAPAPTSAPAVPASAPVSAPAPEKALQPDGVTGRPINQEWSRFAPESGTLNVPRAEMPQIKAEHRGAMVNFLKGRGIESTQEEVPASTLKPTQGEFSPAKVEQAKAYVGGDRAILVSSDGYVVDGHHQWLAKREAGAPVRVIRLGAPVSELLGPLKDFPSSQTSDGPTPAITPGVDTEKNGNAEQGTLQAGPEEAGPLATATPEAPPDIKAIVAKTLPDMTDAELVAARTHYGPDHPRTAKISKEINRRALAAKLKKPALPTTADSGSDKQTAGHINPDKQKPDERLTLPDGTRPTPLAGIDVFKMPDGRFAVRHEYSAGNQGESSPARKDATFATHDEAVKNAANQLRPRLNGYLNGRDTPDADKAKARKILDWLDKVSPPVQPKGPANEPQADQTQQTEAKRPQAAAPAVDSADAGGGQTTPGASQPNPEKQPEVSTSADQASQPAGPEPAPTPAHNKKAADPLESRWTEMSLAEREKTGLAAGIPGIFALKTAQKPWHKLPQPTRDKLAAAMAPAKAAAVSTEPSGQQAATETRAEAEAREAVRKASEAENRRAGQEVQRALFAELSAMPEMVGKSVDEISEALTARLKDRDATSAVNPAQRKLLARALHKHLAANAKKLEQAKHRSPQVKADAVAEAVGTAYGEEGAEPAQHSAFAGGFDHALAGKTKSTLSGDHLADMVKGYEAGMAWRATEAGAAWFEGRPSRKLQNTGIDLRRHWELMKAQMKAGETDLQKAWKQIEAATTRSDLFAPYLPDGVSPGFTKYATDFRASIMPFKKWLENRAENWSGRGAWGRGRGNKSNLDYILDGNRYPESLSIEDRKKFRDDDAYRIRFLQDKADQYVQKFKELTAFLDGATSVLEAAQKFEDAFIDPKLLEKYGADRYWSTVLNELGESMTSTYASPGVWDGTGREFGNYRASSTWTQEIIGKEQTLKLPDRATPLTPPKLDRVTRENMEGGRGGKDVTPADFKAKFGFADVGFGNWVGAKSDQDHLNYAYDAFLDLAKHFGMDASHIGLGKRLHFTIGALGHGKASAHFQPAHPAPNGQVQVINLTSTKGDGTVYHEWAHALDHNLSGEWARVRSFILSVLQHKIYTAQDWEKTARRFLVGGSYFKGDKRANKVDSAIRGIAHYTRAANRPQTAYKENADQLGKDYWGNDKELFARAIEAWSTDTLGGTNTYLVNPAWAGDGMATPAKGYRGTPYPTGAERQIFNKVMGALAKSVKWDGGAPSVKYDEFLANIPADVNEGEARRKELSTEEGMRNYLEQLNSEAAAASSAKEQAEREKKRQEQEALDRIAAEKLAELEDAAPLATVDAPAPDKTSGPLSDDDLSAIFDQAAAELREESQEKPEVALPGAEVAEPAEAPVPAALPPALKAKADAKRQKSDAAPEAEDPTALKLIAEAAKLGVKGADEALKGLSALFGKPGRLNSFPGGFDEETYAQAKPHFKAALAAFQDAGKTLKDLFKMLIGQFGDGIKAYAIQFAKDEGLTNQLGSNTSASMAVASKVEQRLKMGHSFDWRTLFAWSDEAFGGTQGEGKYSPKDAYDAMEAGVNRYLMADQGRSFNPNASAEAAQITVAALERVTALLPTQSMAMDRPAFKDWWRKIQAEYDVRAVIPMDGSGYAKYGTTFDNAILVIDKVKPAGRPVVTTKATTYTELIGLLSEIRNERPAAAIPSNDRSGIERDAAESSLGDVAAPGEGGNLAQHPDGGQPDALGSSEPLPGPAPGTAGTGRRNSGGANRSRGGARQPDGRQDDGRPDAAGGGEPSGNQNDGNSGITVTSSDATTAELTESVFENYQPQRLQVSGALPHPGPLVQSAAMASVMPPKPTYTPNLPRETVEKGLLSIAQIESVVYAGQAHSEFLEPQNVLEDERPGFAEARQIKMVKPRRGFFIGDGTGVGKGREIGGIILDNLRQGRKKHVWISEKQGLMKDAKRDFKGVGGDDGLIFNQNKTKAEDALATTDGVLFTTYATLRSGAKSQASGGKLDKKALEKAYPVGSTQTFTLSNNAVVEVTIESIDMRAKKFVVKNNGNGRTGLNANFADIKTIKGDPNWQTAASATPPRPAPALMAAKLPALPSLRPHCLRCAPHRRQSRHRSQIQARQQAVPGETDRPSSHSGWRVPNARVVYVSATGATQVSNLSYATRLGLWGPGTPFPSVMNFISQMMAGGLAAMELVARDMKQMGVYIARSLSFEGVSEVTGRTQRVVRKADKNGDMKAQLETRGSAAAQADADAFMADKNQILVFSDAGGTGFSFHADLTKKNQRKRKHYLLQPGWRADKAVQGFGRSHRTNQKSAPHYYLASTNIPAQKRFLSAIARRLDQLGALTKGQRDTANQGMFSEKDNLESPYATQAVRQLIEDLQRGRVPGMDFREFLKQTGLEDILDDQGQIAESKMPTTRLFLNRMLSLRLDMQDVTFDAFIQRMEEKIEVAVQRGELDTGMQTIRALSSKVVSDDVVYTDSFTSQACLT